MVPARRTQCAQPIARRSGMRPSRARNCSAPQCGELGARMSGLNLAPRKSVFRARPRPARDANSMMFELLSYDFDFFLQFQFLALHRRETGTVHIRTLRLVLNDDVQIPMPGVEFA